MEKSYKTKQRAAILEYLKSNIDNHITADDIIDFFKNTDNPIGKSTVYRYLDNLVRENIIRKYASIEHGEAACFQYISDNNECHRHFHMKCSKCGNLIHLDCHEVEELSEHIFKEHRFKIDMCKTVLYGICENCMDKE